MRTLVLENEILRMVLLLDKGADIVELRHKPKNIDVLWHSPVGYRQPNSFRGSIETPDSNFMDTYGGGWQDILPTTGSGPVELHGARFGQHGETALLPWEAEISKQGDDSVVADLAVRGIRYPYVLEKRFTLHGGEASVRIREKLTNLSSQTLEFFWLQHPAFGAPFLAPGCRLDIPTGSVVHNPGRINPNGRVADGTFDWPMVGAKDSSESRIDLSVIPSRDVVAEETTFVRVRDGRYTLSNPELGLGVTMTWDASVFPWLWFWQNYGWPDSPYFGEAWNVAVEPSSSLPTLIEKEQGMEGAIKLAGKSSITTEIGVSLQASSAAPQR